MERAALISQTRSKAYWPSGQFCEDHFLAVAMRAWLWLSSQHNCVQRSCVFHPSIKLATEPGGRYYTLDGGIKTQVSNPAGSSNVTITQQQTHHQGYVDDITGQLQSQGYIRTSGGFYSNCGSTICYPDITYSRPGSTQIDGVVEVKTGGAGPSTNQSTVYPQIGTGDAIPTQGFVDRFNQANQPPVPLQAGVPMNQQGYPNGIPVYQITAPGLNP